jgi:hypothetical protein
MPLNSPILTGDVSGGLHTTSVDKLKGQPVAAVTPRDGEVLTWNGESWVPGAPANGGSGGGGVAFYFNGATAAQSPTTGLPGTPVELGRVADTALTTITSGTLSEVDYTLIKGFVSDVLDPGTTTIPAGLFDFNLWAASNASQSHQTIFRLQIFKYDGANAPTLLATSDDVSIYDPTVPAQYIASVVIPQTTLLATDRIYIEVQAKATANNRTITIYTGDAKPSHVHTTIPSVTGTGLVKVVSSVIQSPASLLVDADVDANAAIAQSKIDGLTTALANVPTPGAYVEFFEQFMGTTSLTGNLAFGVSTGATNSQANSGFGIVAMSTGTNISANSQSRLNQAANAILVGNSAARVIFRVGQSGTTWFDATLTGAFRCGWGDSITGESANGIYFRVQNGQAIDFVTRAGNSETLTSTGVSFAANTFRALEILINAAGTQVVAKIDGNTVATHTTNIPTARIFFFAHINRTAAVGTAVVANIDFVYSRITPNTPYFA